MASDDLFGELGGLGGFSPETTFTGGGGGGGFDLGSLFSGLNFKDVLGGLGTAGGIGQQLMNILQTNRAPRTDREPFQQQSLQSPLQSTQGPNANQLRSILANKQASGQSSGGVVSPASIAAIMGQGQQSQIDPRLMQLIMQYTQQLQQV